MREEHHKLYDLMGKLRLDYPYNINTISGKFKIAIDKILENQKEIPDFKQLKLREFFISNVDRFKGEGTPFIFGFIYCMKKVKEILCLK